MIATTEMPLEIRSIDEVPTPALVLDSRMVLSNIQRMAEYGRDHNLAIRPHTKTHKISHHVAQKHSPRPTKTHTMPHISTHLNAANLLIDNRFSDP